MMWSRYARERTFEGPIAVLKPRMSIQVVHVTEIRVNDMVNIFDMSDLTSKMSLTRSPWKQLHRKRQNPAKIKRNALLQTFI